jgi:dipeptidyl aminopeptidase/acylaminoacyl peptidase
MSELSVDDVLDIDYPGPPAWSADGRFVASTVYEDDGQTLRIAAVGEEAGASASWRFAPEDGHVADFAWGPESVPERLAVLSDEGDLLLCNARRETVERLSGDVDTDDVAWASDGQSVAVYRDGQPTRIDLGEGDDVRFDVPERGTFLGEERMLAFGSDDRLLAFRFVDRETKQVGVVDVETGDLVWRSRDTGSTHSPAWAADGRLLVDRAADRGRVREILAVDVADGETQTLHREDEPELGTVSWGGFEVSPSGDRIALALPLDGWEHVYVVDVESGERTQLTAGEFEDKGLAGCVPQWLGDDTLLFASNREDLGERGIYGVSAADATATGTDAEVTELVTGGTNVHPRPSPDGDHLAFVHCARERSPELRVVGLDGGDVAEGEPTRITESGVDDWPVDPIAPEYVSWEGVEGLTVHGYLVDPRESPDVSDDATGLPAVIYVHGGPMRQMRDGWHPSRSYGLAYAFQQYLAHRGFVGLFVNYRGGVGYGRAFREALFGHRGDHEMQDIAGGADLLRELDYTSEKVGLWGLSYGGYAALQLLGTRPETFDVAVNLAGLADLELYRDWAEETKFPTASSASTRRFGGEPWEATEKWAQASPETHFAEYENPLYSFHGTGDRYVNFEQLDVVVDGLLEHDKDHEWEYFPDEKHVFSNRVTWERVFGKIETAFDEHLRE